MTLTRRRFLTSTATVAVAAAAGIAGKSEAAAAATVHHPLRRSTFTPLVGRTMTAAHGGRQTRVRLRRIRDLEESREAFEGSIRILLQAQNESESDDHYCPEQPTLDALVRVLQRLMADESRIDGSMTRDQVLDEIQQGWHEDGHKELKA